ncbi:CRISPR-associated endonuclease Cas1 [bacterium HR08]|nr:CRISPR-associated endonuclease Cas1 [bacterium HR08]
MSSLYLVEQGLLVRQNGERLVLYREKTPIAEVPLLKIERVIIFGHVHLTTGAISALLHHGIDTAFFSWHGRLKGRLVALESKNISLRLKQYERARDEAFASELARQIVRAKVQSSLRVIARYRRNHPEWSADEAVAELERTLAALERPRPLMTLRGLEGQAAAVYFQAYGSMFRRSLRFHKRSRRPPQDPINAALSLGYSLLFNEALAIVSAVGFDPYLGFLHAPEYGRCSLALDVMEEFRAATIDRLVLTLFNTEALSPAHFTTAESGGVWFTPEGKKHFLRQYEDMMQRPFISRHTGHRTTFRRLLLGQAEHLAQVVLNGGDYRPYIAEP